MIHYKVCTLCKQELPRGCFYKNNCYKDGWNPRCKKCARRKVTKGRYRDKEFAKKQVMRYGHAKL
jgi:hypothetical protein